MLAAGGFLSVRNDDQLMGFESCDRKGRRDGNPRQPSGTMAGGRIPVAESLQEVTLRIYHLFARSSASLSIVEWFGLVAHRAKKVLVGGHRFSMTNLSETSHIPKSLHTTRGEILGSRRLSPPVDKPPVSPIRLSTWHRLMVRPTQKSQGFHSRLPGFCTLSHRNLL